MIRSDTPERSGNEYREAAETLRAEEAALAAHEEQLRRETDPDFAREEELVEIRREQRLRRRLASLPQTLTCPRCRRKKESPRQWCVGLGNSDRATMVCRACEAAADDCARAFNIRLPTDGQRDACIREATKSWEVDGPLLRAARLACRVSSADFAAHCGWSGSYQRRLEREGLVGARRLTQEAIRRTFQVLTGS